MKNKNDEKLKADRTSDQDNQRQGNLIKLTEEEVVKVKGTLQETIELSILYDFYGELLTDKNKEVFEEYVFNDLSLAEIAEQKGITRQGVHDIIKRSSKKLREYEDSLHLVEKFKIIEEKVSHIKELIEEISAKASDSRNTDTILSEMNDLTDEILKNL